MFGPGGCLEDDGEIEVEKAEVEASAGTRQEGGKSLGLKPFLWLLDDVDDDLDESLEGVENRDGGGGSSSGNQCMGFIVFASSSVVLVVQVEVVVFDFVHAGIEIRVNL